MNFKVKKSEQFKINEYDICNVMSFLQSILFKDMDLKLEFFEAAIIVKKLPLPKKILNAIHNYIARLKLKTYKL